MHFRTLPVILFCLGIMIFAQDNDRRRQKSSVFNKREVLKSQMESMIWNSGAWSFSPIIGLNQIGYDSNLFSQPQGEEVSDFLVVPEIGLNTFYRFSPRWILNLKTTSQYVWYKDNEQLRGWNPNMEASLHALFKRLYVDFSASYTRDISRINSEIIARSENERTIYKITSIYQLSPRTFLNADFSQYELKYVLENDQLSAYNQKDDLISLSLYYKKTPLFWPFIEFQTRNTDFSNREFPYEISAQTVFIGSRNEQGKRLHYLAKVGYKQDDYTFYMSEGNAKLQADDIVYQIYTRYDLTRQMYFEAGTNQNVIYSYYNEYTHYLSKRILLGLGYKLKNGVEIGPDIYFGSNDYKAREGYEQSERAYDYISSNLNISFPIMPKVKLQVTFGFEDRQLPNYTENIKGWYNFLEVNYRF